MPSKANLAKIHIAKKELALADDLYRDILHVQFGKTSSGDLSDLQATKLLQHFQTLGWKPAPGKRKKYGKKPHNMRRGTSRSEQLGKIEALLTIGDKPWDYADALARNICKVDKVAWVADADLYKIITALRKQAQREGWDLSGEKKR